MHQTLLKKLPKQLQYCVCVCVNALGTHRSTPATRVGASEVGERGGEVRAPGDDPGFRRSAGQFVLVYLGEKQHRGLDQHCSAIDLQQGEAACTNLFRQMNGNGRELSTPPPSALLSLLPWFHTDPKAKKPTLSLSLSLSYSLTLFLSINNRLHKVYPINLEATPRRKRAEPDVRAEPV